jgi:hypothetical protein
MPATESPTYKTALEHYQAGRLVEAERLWHKF